MSAGLIAATFLLAVVVAVRSTWSPCGLSMLSTVTPLAERGRGHRYGVTATWFILGGILGGATLGLVTALGALGVDALDLSMTTVGAATAIAAATALASDTHLFGFALPTHTRQVDDAWLPKYRAWVYGAGFGWQIGVGLATYIMTAGVYLMIVLSMLTGDALLAFVIPTMFGTIRGLSVLLGARIHQPADLMAFHRKFDAIGPHVRQAVLGTLAGLVVLGAANVSPWLALATALVIAAAAGVASIRNGSGSRRRRIVAA